MNRSKNKIIKISVLILFVLIVILLLVRAFLPSQIDDVHSRINCLEIEIYSPEILWVIPNYQGVPISENSEWCKEILSLNKTLGLHGYTHSYKEFENEMNASQIEDAIKIFRDCFGFEPELFKPSQLALSKENKILLEKYNFSIRNKFNQLTHKVYHCNDAGVPSNRFISWF